MDWFDNKIKWIRFDCKIGRNKLSILKNILKISEYSFGIF